MEELSEQLEEIRRVNDSDNCCLGLDKVLKLICGYAPVKVVLRKNSLSMMS